MLMINSGARLILLLEYQVVRRLFKRSGRLTGPSGFFDEVVHCSSSRYQIYATRYNTDVENIMQSRNASSSPYDHLLCNWKMSIMHYFRFGSAPLKHSTRLSSIRPWPTRYFERPLTTSTISSPSNPCTAISITLPTVALYSAIKL